MSRKCPQGNLLLPRMYWRAGRYYYVRKNKWHSLPTRYTDALKAYANLESPSGTWAALVEATYADFDVKPNTADQYNRLRARIMHGFSDFEPHEITATHVTQFLELYRSTPSAANRMLSVLRQVFDKGVRTGACDFNPAVSVRRFSEKKRTRYLTDKEYAAIYAQANPVIRVVMDLCYLTGQRIGDIIKLQRSDIHQDGIHITQEKTGAKLVIELTPDLQSVIDTAKGLRSVPCAYLIHPKGKGTPYSYRALRDAYERARKASGVAHTTLHDLRAKSLTDLDAAGGDSTALAGHRLQSTTLRYLRGLQAKHVKGPSKN